MRIAIATLCEDARIREDGRLELRVDTPREGNHRVLVRAPDGETLADVAVALHPRS